MKQRSIISLALTTGYILFSLTAFAGNTSEKVNHETHKTTGAEKHADHSSAAKSSAQDAHAKAPHSKAQAPHSEELPHIHRFHKDRVKKMKKHHGKYWLLSKVLLALCHLSILVISYLHVIH